MLNFNVIDQLLCLKFSYYESIYHGRYPKMRPYIIKAEDELDRKEYMYFPPTCGRFSPSSDNR